jgi:hypothetical protein
MKFFGKQLPHLLNMSFFKILERRNWPVVHIFSEITPGGQ